MKINFILYFFLIVAAMLGFSCESMKKHGKTAFDAAKTEYDKCVAEKSAKECQEKKEIMNRAKAKFQ